MAERPIRPTVPPLTLERLALGEASPEETARLEREPELLAAVEALRQEDEDILRAYPPAVMAGAIQKRSKASPRPTQSSFWLVPALGAAALGAWLLVQSGDAQLRVDGPDTTRIKGLEPQLVVHRQKGNAVERLGEGSVARAGDLLQLAYVAAGQPHGVVLSIDGRGSVTLHFPATPDASTRLEPHAALDAAYELDDAPRLERFFLVTAARPIDVSMVLERAHKLASGPEAEGAPLALPAGFKQTSITVRKAP